MKRSRIAAFALPLLALAFAGTADAAFVNQTSSVLKVQRGARHPLALEQMLVSRRAIENPSVCVAYSNTANAPRKGKVITRVAIEDANGNVVQNLRLVARVRNNEAIRCKNAAAVEGGYVLNFSHKFKKMARLRAGGGGQYAAVSGVLSSAGRPKLGNGALALEPPNAQTPAGLMQGDEAGWFHSASTVLHAQGESVTHPTSLRRLITMPRDSKVNPRICAAYSSQEDLPSRGQIGVLATIFRRDGSTPTVMLEGAVEDNVFLACKRVSQKIKRGAVVLFEMVFENMPNPAQQQFVEMIGAVSSTGLPTLEGPGGGILSRDDEFALTRGLTGSRNQFHRPVRGIPTKWMYVGRNTQVNLANSYLTEPGTAGFGDTPAEALADYETKQGPVSGTERRLTPEEREAWEWFALLNPGAGPTAIRKGYSNASQWFSDAYRPAFGEQVQGPYSNAVDAIRSLQALGL